MSVRTSVASRGLTRFSPNALSAIIAATVPYASFAARNNTNASASAATSDGKRHAISHDRVTGKSAAEIQPTNGGFVATPSCGVC